MFFEWHINWQGAELDLENYKKMSTDYAQHKKLAIQGCFFFLTKTFIKVFLCLITMVQFPYLDGC